MALMYWNKFKLFSKILKIHLFANREHVKIYHNFHIEVVVSLTMDGPKILKVHKCKHN